MSKNTIFVLLTAAVVLVIVNAVFWSIVLTPRLAGSSAQPRTNRTPVALPTVRLVTPTPTQPSNVGRVGTGTPTPSPLPGNSGQPGQTTPTSIVLTSLEEVVRAVQEGRHGTHFRLLFTEQQIRDEVIAYLATNPDLVFSDVDVSLQQDQAIITGKARILAFNIDFKAATTVVVTNGRPRLKVLSLDVLGGLVPGFVKDQLIQMIERSADLPLLDDLPVYISDVKIEPGQAVVTGYLV